MFWSSRVVVDASKAAYGVVWVLIEVSWWGSGVVEELAEGSGLSLRLPAGGV